MPTQRLAVRPLAARLLRICALATRRMPGRAWLATPLAPVIAAAMALAVAPAPANAQSVTAYYGGGPSSVSFAIPVHGSVKGRCGFKRGAEPTGSFDAGSIDSTGWSNDFAFMLECNGPSRIAVVSANAGLKTNAPPPVPGYTTLAPYAVAVTIVHAAGTTTAVCPAAQLTATANPACALGGTASPTQGLAIPAASFDLAGSFLRVSAPAYAGADVLAAGSYADTLTVTISPAT